MKDFTIQARLRSSQQVSSRVVRLCASLEVAQPVTALADGHDVVSGTQGEAQQVVADAAKSGCAECGMVEAASTIDYAANSSRQAGSAIGRPRPTKLPVATC